MDKIKFATQDFADNCLNIFQKTIDNVIKENFDQIKSKIDTDIRNNIFEQLNTKSMYDYSEIKPLILNECLYNVENNDKHNRFDDEMKYDKEHKNCANGGDCDIIKNLLEKYHTDYQVNEIIILEITYKKCTYNSNFNGHIYHKCNNIYSLILTNFANIYTCSKHIGDSNSRHLYNFDYKKYINNIKLPVDYINIFQLIIKNIYHHHILNCVDHNYNTNDNSRDLVKLLSDLMELIKFNLYNRQFQPLYAIDILKENEELKEKYESVQKYLKEKDDFEKNIKPYINLQEETEKLNEKRKKLILYHKKLELKEKELNEKIEKMNKMTIDDI